MRRAVGLKVVVLVLVGLSMPRIVWAQSPLRSLLSGRGAGTFAPRMQNKNHATPPVAGPLQFAAPKTGQPATVTTVHESNVSPTLPTTSHTVSARLQAPEPPQPPAASVVEQTVEPASPAGQSVQGDRAQLGTKKKKRGNPDSFLNRNF